MIIKNIKLVAMYGVFGGEGSVSRARARFEGAAKRVPKKPRSEAARGKNGLSLKKAL